MPIKKSSQVKKSKGLLPKKSVKRKPAIVGSSKIKMFKTEESSMPVAYRVDSLGRKTLVQMVRAPKDPKAPEKPFNPFKRDPNAIYQWKVVGTSSKKK